MPFFTLTCPDCIEFWGDSEVEIIEGMEDTIKGPGKFESECVWAIHFYRAMLDGGDELCACNGGSLFTVDASDVEHFPQLADQLGRPVHVSTSEQGFVYVEITTQEELDRHIAEAEEAYIEED